MPRQWLTSFAFVNFILATKCSQNQGSHSNWRPRTFLGHRPTWQMDKHTKCKTKLKDLCELSSIDRRRRRRRRGGWKAGVGRGRHGNLWQALTLRSSSSVFFMRTTRRLKRSSSCSSTTPVGDMLIAIIFRIRQVSKAGGRDFSIPAATWSINSSRLMPPEPSPKCRINQKRRGGSSKGKVEGQLVDIGQWQRKPL